MHEGFVTTHIPPGSSETGSPNKKKKKKSQFWSSRLQSNFLALSKYQFYCLTILGKFYKQVWAFNCELQVKGLQAGNLPFVSMGSHTKEKDTESREGLKQEM